MNNALLWIQYIPIEIPGTFTDIGSLSTEVREAIEYVRLVDVTKGVGNDIFDPFGAVPRRQMALFLTRMTEAAGIPLPDGASRVQ